MSGVVRFNGEPVARGTVRFIPTDRTLPTQEGRIEQGRYATSLVPGKKRVEIVAVRDHPTKREPSLTPGETIPVEEYYLPAKFNTETTLSAVIDGPRDDLDFPLAD